MHFCKDSCERFRDNAAYSCRFQTGAAHVLWMIRIRNFIATIISPDCTFYKIRIYICHGWQVLVHQRIQISCRNDNVCIYIVSYLKHVRALMIFLLLSVLHIEYSANLPLRLRLFFGICNIPFDRTCSGNYGDAR